MMPPLQGEIYLCILTCDMVYSKIIHVKDLTCCLGLVFRHHWPNLTTHSNQLHFIFLLGLFFEKISKSYKKKLQLKIEKVVRNCIIKLK